MTNKLLALIFAAGFIALIVWRANEKASRGIGIWHHIATKGLDQAAWVGIVVGVIVVAGIILGKKER